MHLNLNLLTALDALLDEGSVMGAADRLHLSQPAMSRALGRLRAITGDQILVRSGRSMTPTPYAQTLGPQVRALVRTATEVLAPQRALDLATLERTFTIRSHELLTGTIATSLLQAIANVAPTVQLRFIAEAPVDTSELRQGRVDLELGGTVPTSPEISFEILATGHTGVAVRPGHPLGNGTLTLADYAAADHIVVSRRGRVRDLVDDSLEQMGLTRRVVATVPNSIDALQIVRHTDAITTVPLEASQPLIQGLSLKTLPLPFDAPRIPAVASWHQRYDTDPAHEWLRGLVRANLSFAQA